MRRAADSIRPKTHLCELVELLDVSAAVVFSGGELRREEGVDESRLAQSGLACKDTI